MKKIIFISILLLFQFSSCDIFETRDAEQPGQPRSNYQPASTPQELIDNLKNSFIDKNVDNYLSTFTNSAITGKEFVFSPSSAAASQFAGLFETWDLNNERQYFNNLTTVVPDDKSIILEFTSSDISFQADSAFFTGSYSLTVPHNSPDLPKNYQGDLRFSMIRNTQSVWSIYYWQDIKGNNNNLPSWSELKGLLAN